MTDEPTFDVIGVKKAEIPPVVYIKMDQLTGAKFDSAISKFVDVKKRYFKELNEVPDKDDAGEIAFMEKLRTKVQNARDTLL